MQSAVHWDGHDNLLLQLEGRKRVLLLPPDAVSVLGFRRFQYHAWCLSSDELETIGRGGSMAPAFADHEHCKADVENHCTFDAFRATATLPPSIERRAYLAVLEPGQALFVPALWHHAVASEPDPASGLNCAANLWFVLGTAAHDAALRKTPAWPEALFCLAAAKRSLGDPRAAVRRTNELKALRPAMADAKHNLAAALAEAGDLDAAAARFEANVGGDAAEEARRLSGLGVVYKRQNRLEDAAAAFDESHARGGLADDGLPGQRRGAAGRPFRRGAAPRGGGGGGVEAPRQGRRPELAGGRPGGSIVLETPRTATTARSTRSRATRRRGRTATLL